MTTEKPQNDLAVTEQQSSQLDAEPRPRPRVRRAHRGVGAMTRYVHRAYSRVLQRRLMPYNLTVAQYLHLRTLWQDGPMTQIEISQRIGIEKASSTSVIDSLEKEGLILRVRDTQDRRKINVSLSPKGEALRDQVRIVARSVADDAVIGIDDDELLLFFKILDKMIANLDAAI
ncbi:MAG TPA: MarR family transcriptional regulator [Stellaceae bacterium]|nr:MarR family transcriptional regulator [Stellaceae bacterium]